jgi:hypothetical protein
MKTPGASIAKNFWKNIYKMQNAKGWIIDLTGWTEETINFGPEIAGVTNFPASIMRVSGTFKCIATIPLEFLSAGTLHVSIVDPGAVVTPEAFLVGASLASFEIRSAPKLILISQRFLSGASVVDLRRLNCPALREIGAYCFEKLKSPGAIFKLVELVRLEVIGPNFCDSAEIRGIDFDGLQNLRVIGKYFCMSAKLLGARLYNLPSLEAINFFAFDSATATSLELENLPKLRLLGDHFACEATVSERIELYNLPALETIGYYFAFKANLERVMVKDCPLLVKVQNGFCAYSKCSRIPEFINCPLLLRIGSKSTAVYSKALVELPEDCSTESEEIDLGSCPNLETICSGVFRSSSLSSLRGHSLANLTRIGDMFGEGSLSLKYVEISDLVNLVEIGSNFLANCKNLKNCHLGHMPNLRRIGDRFLAECELLEEFDLSRVASATSCGHDFMLGCTCLVRIAPSEDTRVHAQFSDWPFEASFKSQPFDECPGLEYHSTKLLAGDEALPYIVEDFFKLPEDAPYLEVDLREHAGVTQVILGPRVQRLWVANSLVDIVCSVGVTRSIDTSELRSVTIVDDHVEEIGADFLENAKKLFTLRIMRMSKLAKIRKAMFNTLLRLRFLDIDVGSALLTQIDDCFGAYCPSLESVRLSGLGKLRTVGEEFFANCRKLEHVSIEHDIPIEYGKKAFYYTTNLHAVHGLVMHSSLGDDSFAKSGIREFVLDSRSKLTRVGDSCFSGCKFLKIIDFGSGSRIRTIGNNVAKFAPELRSIVGLGSSLIKIGESFCKSAEALQRVDLSKCIRLCDFGGDVFKSCRSLFELRLPKFFGRVEIGESFCQDCTLLANLTIDGEHGTTLCIDNYFLYSCENLVEINFGKNVRIVNELGRNFMRECISLIKIDLTPFEDLSSLGANFCHSCSNLRSVRMPREFVCDMPYCFLEKCSSLEVLDLTPFGTSVKMSVDCKMLKLRRIYITPAPNARLDFMFSDFPALQEIVAICDTEFTINSPKSDIRVIRVRQN